jgi:tape measure domain-containing protein
VTDFGPTIKIDIDQNDVARESDQAWDAFEKRMQGAFTNLGKEFSEAIRDIRGGLGGDAFQGFTRGARTATQAVLENDDAVQTLIRDISALDARFRAFFNSAKALGQDPGLLAAYERELRRLFEIQRRLESEDFSGKRGAARLAAEQANLRAVERGLISERTLQQSHSRDLNSIARQQEVSARSIRDNASRERVAALNAERAKFVTATQLEGAQRLAETRVAGQRQVAQERATQRTRIELLRFTLNQVRALERTLGNVFSGVGAVASGATRRVAQALSNLGDSLRRNNREFSDGLAPALNRRETLISNSFRQQEISVSRSILRQQQTLERFEQQSRRGIAGAVTGQSVAGRGLAGLGLGIGGGLAGGALLAGGFQRFSNLERLTKQFEALTGSIETAQVLLDEVAAFAKQTPFDLVGVADLAKGFLAIGTAAEDVIPRVKVIADAVALTGGNADSLVRIQRAIGQVVSAGRLQGDELNQLAENLPGLNIRQILADQLTGGNVQQLVELQEAGKLTADKFVDGLLTGLGNDPRLVGASEDLAKTLSGRVANLRESFEDFGASLIGLIANPLRSVVLISQTALQGLSDFIKGDVTGALSVLRTAAGGAAIALGGLLAARAAGEAIQFLGLALRAALTPFGIFALAVAGIGAALAVLLERSPEVREAFSALGEAVGNILAPAMEFAAGVLEDFTNLLTRTVLPGLERFAISIAQRIGPALERIGVFIGDTVLPALQRFTEFVLDTAIPAVRDGLSRAFNVARDAAVSFWEFVEPIIAPAIEGFSQLGSALRGVVSGDFSAVLPALAGVARGIGSTFANIGQLIFDGLREPVLNAFNFLRETFSADNLRQLGLNFLVLVEQVGFVLANIITDRRVVTALAAIAAAAAAVAFQFVRGLARGILDNLPDLADALRDLAVFAVREFAGAIADDPEILVIGLTALFAAGRLLAAVRSGFAVLGGTASSSFFAGFRTSATALFRPNQFVNGLFGGIGGLEQQARDAARRSAEAFANEQARARRDLRLLEQPQRVFAVGSTGTVTQQDDINRLKEITTRFGQAATAGALFRAGAQETFRSFGVAAGGAAQVLQGSFREGFSNIGAGLSGAMTAARQTLSRAVQDFKATGIGIGNALGGAILSATGAVLAGKAVGAGQGGATGQAIGIGGIIASALFATAAFGGPASALGLAAGAAVGTLGLVSVALGRNEENARKAAEALDEYRQALRDIGDLSSEADVASAATQQLFDRLSADGVGIIRLLRDAGVSLFEIGQDIADDGIIKIRNYEAAIKRLGLDPIVEEAVLNGLREELELLEAAFAAEVELAAERERLAREGLSANEFIDEAGRVRSATSLIAESIRDAALGMRDFGTNSEEAIDKFADLRADRAESLRTTIDNLNTSLDRVRTKADDARTAVTNFFTSRTGGAANEAVLAAEGIGAALESATEGVGDAVFDAARRDSALRDFASQIQGIINEGFASGAIDNIKTGEDIYAALIPLSQGLDELLREGLISQETRDALGLQITDAVQNQDFQAQVQGVFDAETAADQLQRDLNLYEFELKATLTFDDLETAASVADQLQRAGLTPGVSNVPAALGSNQIGQLGLGGLPSGVNIEAINISGAQEPRRVARETVRELALQGARGGTAVRES